MARGDYTRRVHRRPRATRSASWPAPSTRWPPTSTTVDRQRRDLVANVSHELRTPLSALQAVLENLVDGVAAAGPGDPAGRARPDRAARPPGHRPARPLPGRRRHRAAGPADPCPSHELLDETVAEARLTGRPVEYVVRVDPPGLDRARPTAPGCTSWSPTCSTTPRRHSPPGGTVTVVGRQGRRPDRPGGRRRRARASPAADRAQVFERFTPDGAARGRRHRPRPGDRPLGHPAARRPHRGRPSPTSPDAAAASARTAPRREPDMTQSRPSRSSRRVRARRAKPVSSDDAVRLVLAGAVAVPAGPGSSSPPSPPDCSARSCCRSGTLGLGSFLVLMAVARRRRRRRTAGTGTPYHLACGGALRPAGLDGVPARRRVDRRALPAGRRRRRGHDADRGPVAARVRWSPGSRCRSPRCAACPGWAGR